MLQLDHLPFGTRDVDLTRGELARLGFATTPVGTCQWSAEDRPHTSRSTSVMFERGYLDVIELQAPAWQQHLQSSPMYARGAAPSGIVLSNASPGVTLEEARDTLTGRGLEAEAPYGIVRDQPGAQPAVIHYQVSSLRAAGLPFAVLQDSAPEAMRRPEWLRHPNAAVGLARLHLLVRSLDETAAALERMLGMAGASSAGVQEFSLGATTLALHEDAPNDHLAALARQLTRLRRATLLAVEVQTASLDAVRSCLERGAVPHFATDRSIALAPDAGFGCGFIFVEASVD